MYSHTTSFPDWAKELTQLEFLYVFSSVDDQHFVDVEGNTHRCYALQAH